MGIENGSQLGAYQVVGPLGAGGMGEVYRATDTKLDREVAIKVLPDSMAHDPERVARFEREAKVLAQLNHPMIAAIFGFDEAEGKRFLVLELVEGPTLADRLANGRLPVEESVDIARQIAEALEIAHEKGIIHRDLKPANIKVTDEGQVKVLDFGLAKALAEDDSNGDPAESPTITQDFTRPGVILGTAAYMSPEQARGRPVDRRSDIWSFGVVLYECLTGDSIFRGETVTDSIGAILHKQPDWERLPADTPPTVQLLLRRCLAKDRKRRLRDIGDVRIELEAAIADPTSSALGLARAAITAEGKASLLSSRGIVAIAGTALVTALITVAIGWSYWPKLTAAPTTSPAPVRKLMLNLPSFTFTDDSVKPVIMSPDGSKIVYEGEGDPEVSSLWVRDLRRLTPRELPGTESAVRPFWSPDSSEIGYFADGRLWRINVVGSEPTAIANLPARFRLAPYGRGGAAWLAAGKNAGRVIFVSGNSSASGGLWEVSARGGNPRIILEPGEGERNFEQISALPDGRGVLFVVDPGLLVGDEDRIDVFADGQRKTIVKMPGEPLAFPRYASTGHLFYERRTTSPGIWAMPFSLDRLETTGEEPFKVADGLAASTARDGALLYITGSPTGNVAGRLVWIDGETGEVEPISTREQHMHSIVSLSPDDAESRALVSVEDIQSRTNSIWVHELDSGRASRVTYPPEGMRDVYPTWHPDGEHLFFLRVDSNSGDLNPIIMKGRIDGTGKTEEIVQGLSFSVSADGQYLAYDYLKDYGIRGGTSRGIAYISPLEAGGEPQLLREREAADREPEISPDGGLLAFSSTESGRSELYLTRFPSGEGRWQVSLNGGTRSFWGKDPANQTLYYLNAGGFVMFRVTVKWDEQNEEPEIGTPQRLFSTLQLGLEPYSHTDPTRDGKRLLAVQRADFKQGESNKEGGKVVLVQNWLSEFKNNDSNESP